MRRIDDLDHFPVIGELRQRVDRSGMNTAAEWNIGPVRLKAELAVRPSKAVQVMRGRKIRLAIDPALALEVRERTPARALQCPVDQSAWRHPEAGMRSAKPPRQLADHLVVGAAFVRRLDQFRPEQNVLVTAALIDVVVLEK